MPIRSPIDCVVAVFLIAVGAIGLYGSSIIPPTGLEPVGAAPVPRWISIAIIGMALAMLVMALRPAPAVAPRQRSYRPRPGMAVASVILLILYVLSMHLGVLGFRAASMIYIIAFGVLMSGLQWRSATVHTAIAIVVTLGSFVLFTDYLFIDLPQ